MTLREHKIDYLVLASVLMGQAVNASQVRSYLRMCLDSKVHCSALLDHVQHAYRFYETMMTSNPRSIIWEDRVYQYLR